MAVKCVKYNRLSSACAVLPGPLPAAQREPSILEVKRSFYIFSCPFLKGIIAPSRVGHPVRALPFLQAAAVSEYKCGARTSAQPGAAAARRQRGSDNKGPKQSLQTS